MPAKLTKEKKKELKATYASELEILQGMGFKNTSYCIQLLQKKKGDVNVVVNELLINPGPDEESSDEEIEESKIIEKEGEFKLDFDQIVKISASQNGKRFFFLKSLKSKGYNPLERTSHTSTLYNGYLYSFGGGKSCLFFFF